MSVDFVFIDSGTGGIPYMKDLKKKCSNASCVYLGDTAHFPYGEKTSSEIIECASNVVGKVIRQWSPKAVVIACNTMSVTALDVLRERYPAIKIVGTVPAIRLAAKESKNRHIGLLATNATVNHSYTQKLISDFASDCIVEKRGDKELIAFIEHSLFTATEEEKRKAVKPSIDFFREKGCDTIVLGCTHFTHIADVVQKEAGEAITVIDSRNGVSNRALDVVGTCDFCKNSDDNTFFVTALQNSNDETEYKNLCAYFNIEWGGVI